jgi:hypothetical protein
LLTTHLSIKISTWVDFSSPWRKMMTDLVSENHGKTMENHGTPTSLAWFEHVGTHVIKEFILYIQ